MRRPGNTARELAGCRGCFSNLPVLAEDRCRSLELRTALICGALTDVAAPDEELLPGRGHISNALGFDAGGRARRASSPGGTADSERPVLVGISTGRFHLAEDDPFRPAGGSLALPESTRRQPGPADRDSSTASIPTDKPDSAHCSRLGILASGSGLHGAPAFFGMNFPEDNLDGPLPKMRFYGRTRLAKLA